MKPVKWIAAIALLLACATSLAARPTSIVFESNAETAEGELYGQYTVRCNDGRTVPLTAWDDNRKWCLDDGGSTHCLTRQISAARSACEISDRGAGEQTPAAGPLAIYSR